MGVCRPALDLKRQPVWLAADRPGASATPTRSDADLQPETRSEPHVGSCGCSDHLRSSLLAQPARVRSKKSRLSSHRGDAEMYITTGIYGRDPPDELRNGGPPGPPRGVFQLAETIVQSGGYLHQTLEHRRRLFRMGAPVGGPVGEESAYGGPPLTGAGEAGPRFDAAPLFITIEEAAELVSVDPKTIGRWSREANDFPVFRRGRVVRVHRDRFLTWVERQMPRRAARTPQPTISAA